MPSELKAGGLYRVARILEDRRIAGKPVIFLRYVSRWFDVRRAEVALMNPDGSASDERWLVGPHFILNL